MGGTTPQSTLAIGRVCGYERWLAACPGIRGGSEFGASCRSGDGSPVFPPEFGCSDLGRVCVIEARSRRDCAEIARWFTGDRSCERSAGARTVHPPSVQAHWFSVDRCLSAPIHHAWSLPQAQGNALPARRVSPRVFSPRWRFASSRSPRRSELRRRRRRLRCRVIGWLRRLVLTATVGRSPARS